MAMRCTAGHRQLTARWPLLLGSARLARLGSARLGAADGCALWRRGKLRRKRRRKLRRQAVARAVAAKGTLQRWRRGRMRRKLRLRGRPRRELWHHVKLLHGLWLQGKRSREL